MTESSSEPSFQSVQSQPLIDVSTIGPIINYLIDVNTKTLLEQKISSLCNKEDLQKWLTQPSSYTNEISSLTEQVKVCLIELFPSSLISQLQNFDKMADPQMLIIKNLPFVGPDVSPLAECFLLGLSALLGMKPFTYKNEHNGRLLHHVRPNINLEYSQTGLSSRVELGLHVENAFDPHRPDYMALYCLVGDEHAKTTYYSVSKLQSNVEPELKQRILSIGKENQFVFHHPHSHSNGKPDNGPLFFDTNEGHLSTRFSDRLMSSENVDGQNLIQDLEKFFKTEEGCPNGYILGAGDLIIWSNSTILHGRSAYEPNYQPDKHRFLIRMYLSNDQNLPHLRD